MKRIYEVPMMVTVSTDICDVISTSLSATKNGFGEIYSWNDDTEIL